MISSSSTNWKQLNHIISEQLSDKKVTSLSKLQSTVLSYNSVVCLIKLGQLAQAKQAWTDFLKENNGSADTMESFKQAS
jgi:hypothetical protein